MSIGKRLREFGESKYGSMKDFAIALNMPAPSLQSYLSGKREPGTPIIIRLYNLGCDINWLISGKDSNYPESINDDLVSQIRLLQNKIINYEHKIKVLEEKVKSYQVVITDISEYSNTMRKGKSESVNATDNLKILNSVDDVFA